MNTSFDNLPLSVLDLAVIPDGKTPADAFAYSLDLARKVEQFGYQRFWLAEHHNMPSIASSATAVLIGHIAGGTSTIRVGSGGIMLPNHAPLIIAEQFGTLAALYPDRIDLGLGRAPGTDQVTAMALRRNRMETVHDFPQDVLQLQAYFSEENRSAKVRTILAEGMDVPIWILGSSTDSARLAAQFGLPYAFAAHFAPAQFETAIDLYRNQFKPSESLASPYVMACVNVMAADTLKDANRIATSFFQLATGLVRGKTRPLQPPVQSMEGLWNEFEEAAVLNMMRYSFIGDAEKVRNELSSFVASTGVDELMLVSHIYDHGERLRSFEIAKSLQKK